MSQEFGHDPSMRATPGPAPVPLSTGELAIREITAEILDLPIKRPHRFASHTMHHASHLVVRGSRISPVPTLLLGLLELR
jgi:hypothetical protein